MLSRLLVRAAIPPHRSSVEKIFEEIAEIAVDIEDRPYSNLRLSELIEVINRADGIEDLAKVLVEAQRRDGSHESTIEEKIRGWIRNKDLRIGGGDAANASKNLLNLLWEQIELEKLRLDVDQLLLEPLDSLEIDLMPHQIAAVQSALGPMNGKAILADEVGLGKTIEAGSIAHILISRGDVRRILIVAPRTLRIQWCEEMQSKFGISILDATNSYLIHEYRRRISSAKSDHKIHGIVMTSQMLGRNLNDVAALQPDLVIVDEAHRVAKGASRFREQMQTLMATAPYALFLTATPVQNNLLELYNLVELLRPGTFGTQQRFRSRFVASDERIPKENSLDELRQILKKVLVRWTRAQAGLDSVVRIPVDYPISLDSEELELYQEIFQRAVRLYGSYESNRRSVVARFLSECFARSPKAALASLIRLAERHPFDKREVEKLEMRLASTLISSREKVLLKLASDWIAEHGKVVIFAQHVGVIDRLRQLFELNGFSTSLFHGKLSSTAQAAARREFQSTTQVFLSTDAGAEGINLQFANCIINYDLPWNPMTIEQRIGRLHRTGQTRSVNIANFFAPNTFEAHLYELLNQKLHLFELLFGEYSTILGEIDWKFTSFSDAITSLAVTSGEEQERLSVSVGEQLEEAHRALQSDKRDESALTSWFSLNARRQSRESLHGAEVLAPSASRELAMDIRQRYIRAIKQSLLDAGAQITHTEIDEVLIEVSLPQEFASAISKNGTRRAQLALVPEGLRRHPSAIPAGLGSQFLRAWSSYCRSRLNGIKLDLQSVKIDPDTLSFPHSERITRLRREVEVQFVEFGSLSQWVWQPRDGNPISKTIVKPDKYAEILSQKREAKPALTLAANQATSGPSATVLVESLASSQSEMMSEIENDAVRRTIDILEATNEELIALNDAYKTANENIRYDTESQVRVARLDKQISAKMAQANELRNRRHSANGELVRVFEVAMQRLQYRIVDTWITPQGNEIRSEVNVLPRLAQFDLDAPDYSATINGRQVRELDVCDFEHIGDIVNIWECANCELHHCASCETSINFCPLCNEYVGDECWRSNLDLCVGCASEQVYVDEATGLFTYTIRSGVVVVGSRSQLVFLSSGEKEPLAERLSKTFHWWSVEPEWNITDDGATFVSSPVNSSIVPPLLKWVVDSSRGKKSVEREHDRFLQWAAENFLEPQYPTVKTAWSPVSIGAYVVIFIHRSTKIVIDVVSTNETNSEEEVEAPPKNLQFEELPAFSTDKELKGFSSKKLHKWILDKVDNSLPSRRSRWRHQSQGLMIRIDKNSLEVTPFSTIDDQIEYFEAHSIAVLGPAHYLAVQADYFKHENKLDESVPLDGYCILHLNGVGVLVVRVGAVIKLFIDTEISDNDFDIALRLEKLGSLAGIEDAPLRGVDVRRNTLLQDLHLDSTQRYQVREVDRTAFVRKQEPGRTSYAKITKADLDALLGELNQTSIPDDGFRIIGERLGLDQGGVTIEIERLRMINQLAERNLSHQYAVLERCERLNVEFTENDGGSIQQRISEILVGPDDTEVWKGTLCGDDHQAYPNDRWWCDRCTKYHCPTCDLVSIICKECKAVSCASDGVGLISSLLLNRSCERCGSIKCSKCGVSPEISICSICFRDCCSHCSRGGSICFTCLEAPEEEWILPESIIERLIGLRFEVRTQLLPPRKGLESAETVVLASNSWRTERFILRDGLLYEWRLLSNSSDYTTRKALELYVGGEVRINRLTMKSPTNRNSEQVLIKQVDLHSIASISFGTELEPNLSMRMDILEGSNFDRDTVLLLGLCSELGLSSAEEPEHARHLIDQPSIFEAKLEMGNKTIFQFVITVQINVVTASYFLDSVGFLLKKSVTGVDSVSNFDESIERRFLFIERGTSASRELAIVSTDLFEVNLFRHGRAFRVSLRFRDGSTSERIIGKDLIGQFREEMANEYGLSSGTDVVITPLPPSLQLSDMPLCAKRVARQFTIGKVEVLSPVQEHPSTYIDLGKDNVPFVPFDQEQKTVVALGHTTGIDDRMEKNSEVAAASLLERFPFNQRYSVAVRQEYHVIYSSLFRRTEVQVYCYPGIRNGYVFAYESGEGDEGRWVTSFELEGGRTRIPTTLKGSFN